MFVVKLRSKVRDTHKLTKTKYTVLPYPGKVNLFRALEQRNPHKFNFRPFIRWGKILEAGLDIYDVPGTYKSILWEPNFFFLAANIKTCLENFQLIKH